VTTAKMPPCYSTPRLARVWPDRGRTGGPPRARHVYGALTGKLRHLGHGFDLGKARGPRAARDLRRRGVGRRASADAEGARAWRCGAELAGPFLFC
jgi:hypothetical protein